MIFDLFSRVGRRVVVPIVLSGAVVTGLFTTTAAALEPVLDKLAVQADPTQDELDKAVASLVKRQRLTLPYLRAAILHTAIIPEDLLRPRKVVEKLVNPDNDMIARISGDLSVETLRKLQASLVNQYDEDALWAKVAKLPDGSYAPIPDAAARRNSLLFLRLELIAPALDEVSLQLTQPQLWTDQQMSGMDLEGYAGMLRDRYMLEKKVSSLSESEWTFLQRRMLERLIAPYLRPLAEQPWDQVRFSALVKSIAFKALSQIDSLEAQAILGTYKPVNDAVSPEFAAALLAAGGPKAVENAIRFALFDNSIGGQNAMDFLMAQLTDGNDAASAAIQGTLRDLVHDQARMQANYPGWSNALRLAESLPDRGFIREMLVASMPQLNVSVSKPAAALVLANPMYLAYPEVLDVFLNNGLAKATKAERLGLLDGIMQGNIKGAVPVVALLLEDHDRDILNMACDTLGMITDRKFGRNPEAWRVYLKGTSKN